MKPKRMTAKDLLEELDAELLAHKLDQRHTEKVFLVLRNPRDENAVEIIPHDHAAPKALSALLAKRLHPVGVVIVENLEPDKPKKAGQPRRLSLSERPIWAYEDFDIDDGYALLKRVSDELIAPHYRQGK